MTWFESMGDNHNRKKTTMKKLMLGAALAAIATVISGCGNVQVFDLQYSFNTAYVKWPDGSFKTLKLKKWKDYPGEQLQLTTFDGKVYLVSSINCVLEGK